MNRLARSLLLSCLASLFTSAHVLGAIASVSDVVKGYGTVRLGDAVAVSGCTVDSGHATFTIPKAVAAPVLAGDEQVGVFLSGPGTFAYTTTEKIEFPVVRYNTRTAKVRTEVAPNEIVVHGDFTKLLIWGRSLEKFLPGSAAAMPAGAFEEHRELFARSLAAPVEHDLALHDLADPTARLVRAEIDGDQLFVHQVDPGWWQSETLTMLQKPQTDDRNFKKRLLPVLLSEQGVGRNVRNARPARVTLTNVDLTLVASDKRDVTLSATETFVPQQQANVLRFDLYDREYVEPHVEPRVYTVRSVTDGQGRALPFHHANNELLVSLIEPAPPGKPVTIRFEIEGDFLYRPGGDNYWELGLTQWLPLPDLNELAFTYHGVIKVRKPFVPFSPGKTVRRDTEGDYNVVETQIDEPIQWLAILAGQVPLRGRDS